MIFPNEWRSNFSPLPQNDLPEQEPSPPAKASKFAEFLELVEIILLTGTILLLMIVISQYTLNTRFAIQSPVLQERSFKISNLSSHAGLPPICNVNITFGHLEFSTEGSDFVFYNNFSSRIYLGGQERSILGRATTEPFFVTKRGTKTVSFRYEHGNGWQRIVREKVGTSGMMMHLGLRLDFRVSYDYKSGVRLKGDYHVSQLESYCWDLMIGVELSKGEGKLVGVESTICDA